MRFLLLVSVLRFIAKTYILCVAVVVISGVMQGALQRTTLLIRRWLSCVVIVGHLSQCSSGTLMGQLLEYTWNILRTKG